MVVKIFDKTFSYLIVEIEGGRNVLVPGKNRLFGLDDDRLVDLEVGFSLQEQKMSPSALKHLQ